MAETTPEAVFQCSSQLLGGGRGCRLLEPSAVMVAPDSMLPDWDGAAAPLAAQFSDVPLGSFKNSAVLPG